MEAGRRLVEGWIVQRIPPELTNNARALRREATPAERKLWQVLSDRPPRFTRQLVVNHHIVDLACRSLKLAIELDGSHHGEQLEADRERTARLEAQGWTVLRFWNNDVAGNLNGVYGTITAAISRESTHSQPLPFREGN